MNRRVFRLPLWLLPLGLLFFAGSLAVAVQSLVTKDFTGILIGGVFTPATAALLWGTLFTRVVVDDAGIEIYNFLNRAALRARWPEIQRYERHTGYLLRRTWRLTASGTTASIPKVGSLSEIHRHILRDAPPGIVARERRPNAEGIRLEEVTDAPIRNGYDLAILFSSSLLLGIFGIAAGVVAVSSNSTSTDRIGALIGFAIFGSLVVPFSLTVWERYLSGRVTVNAQGVRVRTRSTDTTLSWSGLRLVEQSVEDDDSGVTYLTLVTVDASLTYADNLPHFSLIRTHAFARAPEDAAFVGMK